MSKQETTRGRRKAAATTKKTKRAAKSKPAAEQDHVCTEPGCEKVCKSAGGLASHRRQAHPAGAGAVSPVAAVEAAIAGLGPLTASQGVLAATVRTLAKALQDCDPTDKAKTSKELRAVWAELAGVAGTKPGDDGDDGWGDLE